MLSPPALLLRSSKVEQFQKTKGFTACPISFALTTIFLFAHTF
jgi:hypothetical protein